MAARETWVRLRLPWDEKVSRHRTKKEARRKADRLAEAWSKGSLGPFEAVEDADGDFVVREVQDA